MDTSTVQVALDEKLVWSMDLNGHPMASVCLADLSALANLATNGDTGPFQISIRRIDADGTEVEADGFTFDGASLMTFFAFLAARTAWHAGHYHLTSDANTRWRDQ